jgi:hypothetical protein
MWAAVSLHEEVDMTHPSAPVHRAPPPTENVTVLPPTDVRARRVHRILVQVAQATKESALAFLVVAWPTGD